MSIPHSRPWITAGDLAAVDRVLRSGRLADGPLAATFEDRMAAWVGAVCAVSTASGAGAIGVALEVLGIGPGDEVVLPTYVCRRVAEAVLRRGARPALCDVGPHWVVTADTVGAVLTPRTRAAIVPHMYGIFADVAAIRALGVPVIEDCAQAMADCGARPMTGDLAVFSFHPTKCLTTGEGGLVAAADPTLAAHLQALRDRAVEAPLSEMGAALGLTQLDRYARSLDARRRVAAVYLQEVGRCAPHWLANARPDRSMHFRFPLTIAGGVHRVAGLFRDAGVEVRRGVTELLHRSAGLADRRFATAVARFEDTVCLPIYAALAPADAWHIARVCERVARSLYAEAAA